MILFLNTTLTPLYPVHTVGIVNALLFSPRSCIAFILDPWACHLSFLILSLLIHPYLQFKSLLLTKQYWIESVCPFWLNFNQHPQVNLWALKWSIYSICFCGPPYLFIIKLTHFFVIIDGLFIVSTLLIIYDSKVLFTMFIIVSEVHKQMLCPWVFSNYWMNEWTYW